MLLVNKTQRIIQVAEVHPENKHGSPTLIPLIGTVEIDDKRWEAIKKGHKVIQSMLDEGWIEEIKATPKLALAEMKPRDAMEVVVATVDVAMLKTWKAVEKRKPVLKAITDQMKRLAGEEVDERQSVDDSEE